MLHILVIAVLIQVKLLKEIMFVLTCSQLFSAFTVLYFAIKKSVFW